MRFLRVLASSAGDVACALLISSLGLFAESVAVAKTPTTAELGVMLKTCSDEADAKGLTVQKGKGEARRTYRKQCMLKNGVAPRTK